MKASVKKGGCGPKATRMHQPSGGKHDTQWEDDEWLVSRIYSSGDSRLLVRSRVVERPGTLAPLERAYELRDVLDADWATRPLSLVKQDGSDALLLDDPGGEVLTSLVGRPWELRPFLRVAIGIADALRHLHEQGIVHKDVKPAHVLVDVGAGKAWLTGFGIASRIPRERQGPPEIVAGSLANIAPQQTGRMNRSVDSRSDLYAFGVTLYQMLTGELSFAAADAMEWIHSHVARGPKPAGERVPGIPAAIEQIVLKLMSKTAEQHYRTAAGVEADLRRCLTELEASGATDPFPLASQDVADRLLVPERLYGRERDVATLVAAFERPPQATTGIAAPVEQQDLVTAVKVSQAVSGEIVLERLIERLMVNAVEQAGADRGLLILVRGDESHVEAEAIMDRERVTVSLRQAGAGTAELPESMLRYVVRTHESVILEDASSQHLFSADPYIVQKRCRSVLFLPLLKQASLKGVLYLENSLSPHVFTLARIEVLGLLASQAAISLENAQLYADLKQAQERTRQVEQRVRQVVDTIPALVWTASPDGMVNYFSQRWLDYTGRSLEEELGWGWMLDVHPDDRDRVRAEMRSSLPAGKASAEVEVRLRRADGTYRWFLGRQVPLHDAAGQIVGWYGTATDIEDRKRAEQSLRRSEAYLAQAQRLSHTGSFGVRLSPEGIVWSKETFRLLGLDDTSKPSLETVFQRTHPEDVALVRQALDEAIRSGAGLDFEHRLVMSDGSVKHVHVVVDTIRDDSGDVELVGAVQDITASKNAFEEIRTLRDRLVHENVALREEVDKVSMFEDIVGSSPPLRAVLSRVSKVAPTDSTAFITGETGTGKELIARAIHRRSPRSSRPFVAVNCVVIPKDLIASELFGHEKGAFTGALQRRAGRFELAEGGTLFLDEVAEIPPEIQVALLRVLQERRFERVGGTQSISNDVRVIAATNVDLDAAMNAGAFRRDLFYRLNVFPIQMPSLRERREDIPLLVGYFIERFAMQAGKRFSRINKKSLDLLQSYDWPGNVRELQNVIERSVILCDTEEFSVDQHWLASPPPAKEPTKRTLSEQLIGEERKLIEAALAESGGKVSGSSGAAVKLGMPATTLYSKIQSLKIDRRCFKRY